MQIILLTESLVLYPEEEKVAYGALCCGGENIKKNMAKSKLYRLQEDKIESIVAFRFEALRKKDIERVKMLRMHTIIK